MSVRWVVLDFSLPLLSKMKYFYAKVRKIGHGSNFSALLSAKNLPNVPTFKHLKDSLVIVHFQKSELD